MRLVRSLDPARAAGASSVPPGRLAVCRFWDAALQVATGAADPLVAELHTLGPWLSWTQNPNYRLRPPDASFLDNYGYTVIAGPADGPPALALDPRLALGVLFLGPGAHYPLHARAERPPRHARRRLAAARALPLAR